MLLLANGLQAKPVQVVSSIKPLALIVKAVAGDTVEQQTLLASQLSPHHYALKVSDLKKLKRADLVVWVGPSLETFLAKPLVDSDHQLRWLDALDHSHIEPHPWLSISQTLQFAARIKGALSDLQPSLEPQYANNLKQLQLQLLALDAEASLAFNANQPRLLVMHNAYQELVEAYRLKQLGVILPSAGKKPGVKHIKSLQDLVVRGEVDCLVAEYGQSDKWLNVIDKQQTLSRVYLDPLASRKETQSYLQLITGLQQALYTCGQS